MTEQFYRDIAALQQARTACLEYPTDSLDSWALSHLETRRGENILSIGCDHKALVAALARIIGEDGYVLAIDRSYKALNALSQYSRETGLEQRVRFLYLTLDNLGGHLRPDYFDRVVGGHALFYMKQPQMVFKAIRQALKPGGLCFLYGSSRKDLAELRLFHASLNGEPGDCRELLFIEQVGVPTARDTFSQVEFSKLECPLRFTSPDALYTYWRSSALYEETLERSFRAATIQHFQKYSAFETAQRLIGIRAING